jgi:pyruvate dehydrogenase E2 component (dihydrolipoamide acetyltransferase)
MIDFRMPSLGADMEAGTLVEWLVQPGDQVKRGDVVAIVETQKGAIEIEIFSAGQVSEILIPIGGRVPVGTVLARLDGPAHKPPPTGAPVPPLVASPKGELPKGELPASSHSVAAPALTATPLGAVHRPPGTVPGTVLRTEPIADTISPPSSGPARLRASPAARRLAAEQGIALISLTGSGPGGAIVVADLPAIAGTPTAAVSPPRRRSGFDPAAMRQAIAAAMTRSKREIPHYYLNQTVDVSAALTHLERLNRDRPPPERILPAALFLRAIAAATARTPELNGFWEGGQFCPGDGVHVGWAIALRGGGLVAPAVRDANRLSLDQVMAALRELVTRARASGLRSSDMSGATITVTSLGDRGAESVWPVIYPPQVAMVGIGRIVTRPWVVGDAIGQRPVVTLTLAGDHRASDGHRGGQLLAGIEQALQETDAS